MSTNRAIWLSPLQSSSVLRGVPEIEIIIGIISGRINHVTKSNHVLERRDLIMGLVDKGLSYTAIADKLNGMGLKKPRGGVYESQTINMSVYQWRKRERREEEHSFFLKSIRLVKR